MQNNTSCQHRVRTPFLVVLLQLTMGGQNTNSCLMIETRTEWRSRALLVLLSIGQEGADELTTLVPKAHDDQ